MDFYELSNISKIDCNNMVLLVAIGSFKTVEIADGFNDSKSESCGRRGRLV